MTIQKDVVTLWDDGFDKLCLFPVPDDAKYNYIDGLPCITIGISYENEKYKGCDTFTLFDRSYTELINTINKTYCCLNGVFRLYDMGADTDGYINFQMNKGKLCVKGQLGASFSSHSLAFSFEADQTLLERLMQSLSV